MAPATQHRTVPPPVRKAALDPALKAIGRRIRACREARAMSQDDFAAAAQIDRSYVSGIENGRRDIGVLVLLRIARALKVSPEALLP